MICSKEFIASMMATLQRAYCFGRDNMLVFLIMTYHDDTLRATCSSSTVQHNSHLQLLFPPAVYSSQKLLGALLTTRTRESLALP